MGLTVKEEKAVKVSFQQVIVFRTNAEIFISTIKEETKFKYALEKMMERTKDLVKKWSEKYEDIEMDHANTDEKGSVLFDVVANGRKYHFTKEALKKRDKAVNEAFEKKNQEIIAYYSEAPADMHESYKTVFAPFVIKPD